VPRYSIISIFFIITITIGGGDCDPLGGCVKYDDDDDGGRDPHVVIDQLILLLLLL
jgi:hypothetical protein